jgi:IS1 family transposase
MEGAGVNATVRMTGVSKPTILKLVADLGTACADYHDKHVRGLKSVRIQCDEIWAFNYCKKVNVAKAKAAPAGAGDVWTWTALDADSKLMVSYLVGSRDRECARDFMDDLGDRLANRVQLTTDGFSAYRNAVDFTFGNNVDFAQLIKLYSATPETGPSRRYSPGICTGVRAVPVYGLPDRKHVSTSFIESHNQKIRQHNRRLTRLTSGHSKKFENHVHHLSIFFLFYNFARIHSSLRMTPAMAAGISDHVWTIQDVVLLMDV